MKKIILIGSGQIGSRHFQALKAVSEPLDITVLDPSQESLGLAKERYDSLPRGNFSHTVAYGKDFPEKLPDIDFAIIATNSDARRSVTEKLLKKTRVKNLLLEKILFLRKQDYFDIKNLLEKTQTRAWVNLSMRMHPLYGNMKERIGGKKIFYHASGGQFGLITNAIHYLSHMAYLLNCQKFTIDASLLDRNPVPSKRKGFLEYHGTLQAKFADGSLGIFESYPRGFAPCQVTLFNENVRLISRESEGKSWESCAQDNWRWKETRTPWPYQSQMTTVLAENIFHGKECLLPDYTAAMETHLQLLEPLLERLNQYSEKKYDYYPFT